MERLAIRDAADADIARLRAVFRASAWSNEGDRPTLTEHPEYLELAIDTERLGRTRVAELDGRIVGFVSTADDGSTDREIEDLFVDPPAMRRGVGRSLVLDVVDRARLDGVARLTVEANDHAIEFYERVGFTATDRIQLTHGVATRMEMTTPPCDI